MSQRRRSATFGGDKCARSLRSSTSQTPGPAAAASPQIPVIKTEQVDEYPTKETWLESATIEDRKNGAFSAEGDFIAFTYNSNSKRTRKFIERGCVPKSRIAPPGSKPAVHATALHNNDADPPLSHPQGREWPAKRIASRENPVPSIEVPPKLRKRRKAQLKAQRRSPKKKLRALPSPSPSAESTALAQINALLQADPALQAQVLQQLAPQKQQQETPENSQDSINAVEEKESSVAEAEAHMPDVPRPRLETRASSPETDNDTSSDYSISSEDEEMKQSEDESSPVSSPSKPQRGTSRSRITTPAPITPPPRRLPLVLITPFQPKPQRDNDNNDDSGSDSDYESGSDPEPFTPEAIRPSKMQSEFPDFSHHIPDGSPVRERSITYLDVEELTDEQLEKREAERCERDTRSAPPARSRSASTAAESLFFPEGSYHNKRRRMSRCQTRSLEAPPPYTWPAGFTAINQQPAAVAMPPAQATQPEPQSQVRDTATEASTEHSELAEVHMLAHGSDPIAPIVAGDATQLQAMSTPPPTLPKRKTPPLSQRKSAKKAKVAASFSAVQLSGTEASNESEALSSEDEPSSQTSMGEMKSSPPKDASHSKAKAAEAAAKKSTSLEIEPLQGTATLTAQRSPKGKGVDRNPYPIIGTSSAQPSVEEVPSREATCETERFNGFLKKYGHPLLSEKENAAPSKKHRSGPKLKSVDPSSEIADTSASSGDALTGETASTERVDGTTPVKRARLNSIGNAATPGASLATETAAFSIPDQESYPAPTTGASTSSASTASGSRGEPVVVEDGPKSDSAKRRRVKSRSKSVAPTSAIVETAAATLPQAQTHQAPLQTPIPAPHEPQRNSVITATAAPQSATIASGSQSQPSAARDQPGRRGDRGRNRNKNRNTNPNPSANGNGNMTAHDARTWANLTVSTCAAPPAQPRQAQRPTADELAVLNGFESAADAEHYHNETWQEMTKGFMTMVDFFEHRILTADHVNWYKKRANILLSLVEDGGRKGVRCNYGLEKSRRR